MEAYLKPSFGNLIETPSEILELRAQELTENLKNINYSPHRKAQIDRELSHIALELWCKWRDEDGNTKV